MATFDWSAQGGSGPATYQDFLVPAMFTPYAESLARQVGVGEGSRVLDVACGTGAASRVMARRAGGSGSVVGVDMGEPTLAIARTIEPEDGAAPIDYRQGDAAALPVEDGAFDVAICQQGLQFFPEKEGALREMLRALKPGGRLGVATWAEAERQPFGAVVEALARHLGDEARGQMNSPFALPAAELERLVGAAGFSDVDLREEEIECTFAAAPEDFARRTIAAGPLAPFFFGQPEETQRAVADDVAKALAPYAVEGGGAIRAPMVSNLAVATA